MTSSKVYWSTLKIFLHNKKIPWIPPLRYQNKYVTDLKEKTEIFNYFLAEQNSLINNSSKLPLTFLKRTEKIISSILFSSNDIANIIRDLDPNKAHGHVSNYSYAQNLWWVNFKTFKDNFQILHPKKTVS